MSSVESQGYFLHRPGELSRGAVLDVGLKCVHSCRFCYYSYLDGSEDQFRGMRRAEFRTLEECKEILWLLAQQGFVNFDVTGGEPTLHQQIVEITRYAHQELGLKGRIITLGQYLMRRMKNCQHERLIDDLLEAGLVNLLFSMHAVDEALFHKLTGESWDKQRCAMNYLDEKGFQFTTNTTVVEWNYRQLPDIAREILRHGIYLHNFIVMNAYYEWNRDGRAFGVQARYADIYPYLREAVEILEENDVAVNIRYAPLCAVRGMEKNLVGMVGVRYDPYEWMNAGGHFGGTPAQCAARLPVREGEIEDYLAYRPVAAQHENGVRITGVRGANLKHFAEPCARCAAREVCDGIDPNYLKNHGPDEFTPYDTPEHAPLHRERYRYLMPFLVKTDPYVDMKAAVKEAFAAWRQRAVTPPPAHDVSASLPTAQPEPTDAAPASSVQVVAVEAPAPKVSVVITCYNYGRYLTESVGSVLAQTFRDYEIIVVDDGSTDETPSVLESIIATHPDAPIRVIRQPNSGQPAYARNRGIREARGEYILCLDADDMIAPTMLARCVEVLEADPAVAIAYTDRLDFDGVTQLVRAAPYDPARLPYQNHISYCALYRRRIWEEIGGYRDNVKGCEDWDFWVAACARGYYGRYIPEPLFLYRRHDTGLYQHALAHFDNKRAQIMLNNSSLYRPEDLAWARAQLAGTTKRSADATAATVFYASAGDPLVSVVIPSHNRPRLLADALSSLVAQDYPNWEGIVVADSGVDVAAIVEAADPERRRLRYFRLPRALGPGAARNMALMLARGEIICYLDDDDLWQPDHLSTVVAALSEPGCDFVYTDALLVPERVEPDGRRMVLGAGSNPFAHDDFSRARLLVANYIPIDTWAHRWALVRKAGLFDEQLPELEDWEYLIRLVRHTTPRHLARTTVEVRMREGAGDQRNTRRDHTETFREIYARSQDLAAAEPDVESAREAFLASRLVAAKAARSAGPEEAYARWCERHTLEVIDGELFAERMLTRWTYRPRFHLLVIARRGKEELLAETFDALATQLYSHWGLTIVADFDPPAGALEGSDVPIEWRRVDPARPLAEQINAAVAETESDWIAWIPAGLRPAPHLLLRAGDYANLDPRWKLLYTDSDHIDVAGRRVQPCFRPDFNLDLLRSQPYFGELLLVARRAFDAVGGFRGEFAGAEQYDLALRVLEHFGEQAFGHIDDVLYSMPADCAGLFDECQGRAALTEHLERLGISAEIGEGLLPGSFRVVYRHATEPLVTIAIFTRDKFNYLKPCVESLLAKTRYPRYELVIVDNASRDPSVLAYLESLPKRDARVRVLRFEADFNFAAMANFAAREARGEYLLFLNNDTQIVHEEWLERMLHHAQRPEVGAVGARLVFPETSQIQHAGVVLGLKIVAGHPFEGLDLRDSGYLGRAQLDQNYSAVSGACLLVRKTLYEQVGGMDEECFAFWYNDVDLCLKLGAAGFKIVWTPYATVVHHDGATLRPTIAPGSADRVRNIERYERELEAMIERWLPRLARDPAYNRHLSLVHNDFRVEQDIVINWDPHFHDRPHLLGLAPSGGSGEYRVIAPFRVVSRAGFAQTDVIQAPNFHQMRIPSVTEVARAAPDAMLFHAALSDGELSAMAQIRRHLHGVRLIYSLDDLVTDLPPGYPTSRYAFPDIRQRLHQALSYCERAIVTTEPLAELLRDYGAEVHIVPNLIERAQWEEALAIARTRRQTQRGTHRRPRVGWVGTQQDEADLMVIAEVVAATAAEVDWVFFGMCPYTLRGYVREVHDFKPGFADYLRTLAALDLDLAVAPLVVHPFNEAKSNLRLLEYGMLGWPVVASDILPYQSAPVYRVPNTPQAWLEAIRARLNDPEAARAEGARLQEWVMQHHLLEAHVADWAAALGLER